MSKATTRFAFGIGLILAIGAILVGDVALARWTGIGVAPGFWMLLLGVLLAGCAEFFAMLRLSGQPVQPKVGLAFVALLVVAAFGETQMAPHIGPRLHDRGLEVYLLLVVGLVFTTFLAEIGRVERTGGAVMSRALASVGWTVLAVLTVGLLGVFLAKVRFLSPDPMKGLMYLTLTIGVVKGSDIGAYLVGSTIGRHKLVPTLSPAKTVEGVVGALAAGVGVAMAIGIGWGHFAWWQMLLFGVVLSASGTLGDLAESLIKRGCGVKDSGHVPAFGGVLDIIDSVLASGPVAYLLLAVLTSPGQ